MRLLGELVPPAKKGGMWAVGVPILGIFSQGRTKTEAFAMIEEAVQLAADIPVVVEPHGEHSFTVRPKNEKSIEEFVKFMFRQNRGDLSVRAAATKLGSRSPNAYARYEQGDEPGLLKLDDLFGVRDGEVVLGFISTKKGSGR